VESPESSVNGFLELKACESRRSILEGEYPHPFFTGDGDKLEECGDSLGDNTGERFGEKLGEDRDGDRRGGEKEAERSIGEGGGEV